MRLTGLEWTSKEMVRGEDGYLAWVDAPLPEPGDEVSMNELREVAFENAQYVEMPCTAWGDYVGSTVERANYLELVETYWTSVIEVHGGFDSHYLMVPRDRFPGDLEEMARQLMDVYPVINETRWSQLQMDIAEEMWDCYLRHEIMHALADLGFPYADEQWVRERFYILTYEQAYGPECEDAVSAIFPFQDECVAQIARELSGMGPREVS